MIRINLLPVRQARKRESGKQQLLLGAVVLVLTAVVLIMAVYLPKRTEVQQLNDQQQQLQSQLSELRSRSADLDALRQRRSSVEREVNVLLALEAQRSGPVPILDELKYVLNMPINELQRAEQHGKQWDVGWDPTSLWIDSLSENGSTITLQGRSLRREDATELSIRMSTSPFFSNVRLSGFEGRGGSRGAGAATQFSFTISADVDRTARREQG